MNGTGTFLQKQGSREGIESILFPRDSYQEVIRPPPVTSRMGVSYIHLPPACDVPVRTPVLPYRSPKRLSMSASNAGAATMICAYSSAVRPVVRCVNAP